MNKPFKSSIHSDIQRKVNVDFKPFSILLNISMLTGVLFICILVAISLRQRVTSLKIFSYSKNISNVN